MSELSLEDKRYLLHIARQSIMAELAGGSLDRGEIPEGVTEDAGVFVTLTQNGQLRGCIGSLEPTGTVADSVVRNAKMAAFDDPRFDALREDELAGTSIEISVLSPLKPFEPGSPEELMIGLEKDMPGLVLSSGVHHATFLPQVWEEVGNASAFLSHLCAKAGLPPMFWRDHFDEMRFQTYMVDSFSDKDV